MLACLVSLTCVVMSVAVASRISVSNPRWIWRRATLHAASFACPSLIIWVTWSESPSWLITRAPPANLPIKTNRFPFYYHHYLFIYLISYFINYQLINWLIHFLESICSRLGALMADFPTLPTRVSPGLIYLIIDWIIYLLTYWLVYWLMDGLIDYVESICNRLGALMADFPTLPEFRRDRHSKRAAVPSGADGAAAEPGSVGSGQVHLRGADVAAETGAHHDDPRPLLLAMPPHRPLRLLTFRSQCKYDPIPFQYSDPNIPIFHRVP